MAKLHEVEIHRLRPTQITVGMIEVHDKRNKLKDMKKGEQREFMQAHPIQQFFGSGNRFIPIDNPAFGAFITKKHIFGDGKKWNKCKFLMDNNKANFFRVVNILKPALLTFKIDFPAV